MSIWAYTYLCTCVFVQHVCVCICVCMYMYLFLCLCICVYLCLFVYLCVCACMYVCICVYVYICMDVYMCVNMCVYLCVCLMCLCMWCIFVSALRWSLLCFPPWASRYHHLPPYSLSSSLNFRLGKVNPKLGDKGDHQREKSEIKNDFKKDCVKQISFVETWKGPVGTSHQPWGEEIKIPPLWVSSCIYNIPLLI